MSCWIFLNIKNNLCTYLCDQNRCLIIRVFNSIPNIFHDFALVWVVQSSLLTSYVFKMIEGYGPHMCGSSWIEKLLPTIILHESKFSGVWGEGFFQVPEITLYFFCLWCCVDQQEYESIIIGNESSKFRFQDLWEEKLINVLFNGELQIVQILRYYFCTKTNMYSTSEE